MSALPLLARRRAPVLTLGAVLLLGLETNASVPMTQHFNATLAVALFTVARTQVAIVVVLASLAAVMVPLAGRLTWPSLVDVLGSGFAGALVVITAAVIERCQRDIAAKRELLADRAVAAERRRIARELHDIVAHHITTMQLMAGGARTNLVRAPDAAREALVALESSGRMALSEMRQLLDVLRAGDETEEQPTTPQPGIGELKQSIAESCRAGLPTTLVVRGEERPLPPSLGLAVFRIVQEALTNARKHAGKAQVSVTLAYEPDGVVLEVSDDGVGLRPEFDGVSGYGLIGMRERAVLHGGTMEAGPLDDGGFRVLAQLPLKAKQGRGNE
ncbi:sensor histidine kinase [Streptomyces chartreusis]